MDLAFDYVLKGLTGCMLEKINILNEEKHQRDLKSPFMIFKCKSSFMILLAISNQKHFKLIAIKLTNLVILKIC